MLSSAKENFLFLLTREKATQNKIIVLQEQVCPQNY